MKQVSDVLRAAMHRAKRRGVSLYRIAKACELDDSIVYRFFHRECGLALSSVDRLCEFLELELVRTEKSEAPEPTRPEPVKHANGTKAAKKAPRAKKAKKTRAK